MIGDINKRIKIFCESSGMSVNKFATAIGISQPSAKAIVDNSNLPSYKALYGIAIGFPMLSMEWLIRGNGEMLLDSRLDEALNSSMSAEDLKKLIDERINQALENKLRKEA